jgi:hypothetical protein
MSESVGDDDVVVIDRQVLVARVSDAPSDAIEVRPLPTTILNSKLGNIKGVDSGPLLSEEGGVFPLSTAGVEDFETSKL